MPPRCVLLAALFLLARPAFGHDAAEHLDPELLTGWRTWLHLTIQWAHLVAFALWFGLTAGVLLLKMKPALDGLLYGSWVLFLVSAVTGAYNTEWSAGISETPSLFLLPVLHGIPYGVAYTLVLAVKSALYAVAVLFTLVITVIHLQRRVSEDELRKIFLCGAPALATLLTLAASVLLFYHEVADLWPTPVHSQGGVMGPEGPLSAGIALPEATPPNDFAMLGSSAAWADIVLRSVHLAGFGLWLGGSAWLLVFGGVPLPRYLLLLWLLLPIQAASGFASMSRWAPFYPAPYVWNLSELSSIRFGRSYALFMAAKHLLVLSALAFLVVWTVRYFRRREANPVCVQPLAFANVLLGLAIAYVVMILLLLHEGVDHAL